MTGVAIQKAGLAFGEFGGDVAREGIESGKCERLERGLLIMGEPVVGERFCAEAIALGKLATVLEVARVQGFEFLRG